MRDLGSLYPFLVFSRFSQKKQGSLLEKGWVEKGCVAGAVLSLASLPTSALATAGVAPPAVYPADTWQGRGVAVVRVLNRIDSHTVLLTIPVGETGHYRTLSLNVSACLERPQTLQPDTAVHLRLEETAPAAESKGVIGQTGARLVGPEALETASTVPPFDGWLLTGEPDVSVYASPLYAVQPVRCEGPKTAPDPGPLPTPESPKLSGQATSSASGASADSSSSSAPSSASSSERPSDESTRAYSPPSAPSGSGKVPGGHGGPLSLLPSTGPLPPPVPQAGAPSSGTQAPLRLAPPLSGTP